ncbi:unnamed protein product [Phytomonas sp. EM1]|nr:unnamed protein product [Phytomonas sp. EM1]|eukprot:CCW61367.1 unnamed protein product [Phytomonas sp. isolate EM1]
MPIGSGTLTAEEKYIVWSERIRLMFQPPYLFHNHYPTDRYERVYSDKNVNMGLGGGSGSEDLPHSSSSSIIHGRVESVGGSTKKDLSSDVGASHPDKYYDQDMYPFCFYRRMLQTVGKENSPRPSYDHHSEMDTFNAEDVIADRLAVKLRNAAAETRRQKAKESSRENLEFVNAVKKDLGRGGDSIVCRDASLDVMLSAMHDDMTELLLYAQKENRASHELQSQLAHSRLLLLRYSTANEGEYSTARSDTQ